MFLQILCLIWTEKHGSENSLYFLLVEGTVRHSLCCPGRVRAIFTASELWQLEPSLPQSSALHSDPRLCEDQEGFNQWRRTSSIGGRAVYQLLQHSGCAVLHQEVVFRPQLLRDFPGRPGVLSQV